MSCIHQLLCKDLKDLSRYLHQRAYEGFIGLNRCQAVDRRSFCPGNQYSLQHTCALLVSSVSSFMRAERTRLAKFSVKAVSSASIFCADIGHVQSSCWHRLGELAHASMSCFLNGRRKPDGLRGKYSILLKIKIAFTFPTSYALSARHVRSRNSGRCVLNDNEARLTVYRILRADYVFLFMYSPDSARSRI